MQREVQPLLAIDHLSVYFRSPDGLLPALTQVSARIDHGESVALVGESGSGKSVLAQSVLRLKEYEADVSYEGTISLDGIDVLSADPAMLRAVRGRRVGMVFQDPLTTLSPVHTVGTQLDRVLRLHTRLSKRERHDRALELLEHVALPNPQACLARYPFELSGGMCQRVILALALAAQPKILIADEPTTALDVTTQAEVLRLLKKLHKDDGLALLFITHDLFAARSLCDRMIILYLGQIMEEGTASELFEHPAHPYTQSLLACMPTLTTDCDVDLLAIQGSVPALSQIPAGCPFCTRCPQAHDRCFVERPSLTSLTSTHASACWLSSSAQKGE